MQTTIAFISYPVTNLDRAVEFYQKVLGKEPLFHRDDWAEFELGGQRLALNKSSSTSGIGAIVYFLAQPIEGFILRMKELDAVLDGNIEIHSYGKLARFRDPDGNILGLYEPPD
jgi:predicted enzyme related to lactoylglutathione lyase